MSLHEDFRRAIRDLNLSAQGDLRVALRGLGDSRDGKALLKEILPDLVDAYGDAAASLAADYYDELRDAERVLGRFTARVPRAAGTDTSKLVNWALGEANSPDSFVSLVTGGVQKRISNVARSTVMESSFLDPKARGWMRIGNGGCDFCAMLVSRGSVYTESSVDFSPHDWCNCGAAPAWNPEQVKKTLKPYVESAKRRTEKTRDADNARVRAWIADNL